MFVQTSLARLEQLQLGRASLVFGRIDVEPVPDGDDEPTERFYIGRLAVSDEGQEPLVVDWRAPIAEGFYRATGRSPMGLRRRRHFATEGRRLLGIEDELFRADGADGEGDATCWPAGALLAALQRSRSGQMRDIVATVQREQDEIIRAELPGVLVVQGGPGTGKTAVRCTGPPTCSTPTASSWSARACSSSVPISCSCATSSRCSRHSARAASP